MKKEKVLNLVNEAMDSYKLLISIVGKDANMILIKWPDTFQSYLTDDKLFEKDIAILICNPIKTIIDVLVALLQKKYNIECSSEDAEKLLKFASDDPILIKSSLIKIANSHIRELVKNGENLKE